MVVVGVCAAAVQPAVMAQLLPQVKGNTSAAAGAAGVGAATTVELRYVAICVVCFAFPAIANCIKERVFRCGRTRVISLTVLLSWSVVPYGTSILHVRASGSIIIARVFGG